MLKASNALLLAEPGSTLEAISKSCSTYQGAQTLSGVVNSKKLKIHQSILQSDDSETNMKEVSWAILFILRTAKKKRQCPTWASWQKRHFHKLSHQEFAPVVPFPPASAIFCIKGVKNTEQTCRVCDTRSIGLRTIPMPASTSWTVRFQRFVWSSLQNQLLFSHLLLSQQKC